MKVFTHDSALASTVAEFCLRGYEKPGSSLRESLPSSELWQGVVAAGTDPWLDTGDVDAIKALWTKEFTSLTTNNTLLNKEVQKGIYDDLVPEVAAMLRAADSSLSDQQVVLEIAFVLNAVHGLKLVSSFDADVSVELHTDLSCDAEASYQYGKRYAAINPERFIVKVPLTPEGLIAARRLSDDGIRVNFTLGFSARQNYMIAKLARPSWVNVFMGRLNSFVADNHLGDGVNVGEKATLSSQRVIGDLRDHEGIEVKQIGASIRSGQQVFDLIGVDVQTIPTGAAEAFQEMQPAGTELRDRSQNDPAVALTAGVEEEPIQVFWKLDDALREAVDGLAKEDVASMSGDSIRAALRQAEVDGIFPEFDPAEQEKISAEGKIPVFKSWQSRVALGNAAWDGLLTAAALASFAADQEKLDDRIRKYL
jgi:transaldolase